MSSFDKALETLSRGDRPRVWSLVVTIFGDLAQNQGDEISAQTLGRLTEPMGVKSEALRVALHRLRKDGWIDSTRIGRSRTYRLTEYGLEQSALATPRIYGRSNPHLSRWVLITTDTADVSGRSLNELKNNRSIVHLGANCFLTQEINVPKDNGLLITTLNTASLPNWVRSQVIDPQASTMYDEFQKQLAALKANLPASLTDLERAVLRTLVVHNWRRIVLRHIDIPDSFYPKNCTATKCRSSVFEILDVLKRPTLDDLVGA